MFELSDFQIGMMHSGAMNRIGTDDPDKGWDEVRRWLDRLNRARDHRFYSSENHPAA